MDKSLIILEIGGSYTRCGYSSEAVPRFTIPTDISPLNLSLYLSSGTNLKFKDNNNNDQSTTIVNNNQPNKSQLKESLYNFLNKIFFKYLLCDPGDRKIVIVENIFVPRLFRQTLASVLFEQYSTPSISYFNPLVCLLPLLRTTGLIIDCGYNETRVIPVYEGIGILKSITTTNRGFYTIQNRLKNELIKIVDKGLVNNPIKNQLIQGDEAINIISSLSNKILEDIIVRCLVVQPCNNNNNNNNNNQALVSQTTSISYRLDNNIELIIPPTIRLSLCDCLFNDNDNGDSEDQYDESDDICKIILNSLSNCDIDIRKSLCHNIVLIGGTCMITGFKSRLVQELNQRLSSNDKKDEGLKGHFEYIKHSFQPSYLAWLGASLVGSLETSSTKLTLEQFLKNGNVPEWEKLTTK